MTSERPGSAALSLGAGATGPGEAERVLKLKEDEMGAIHTGPGKPGGRPGLQALNPLRARPGGKGSERKAQGWKGGRLWLRGRISGSGAIPWPLEKEGEGWPRTPGFPHPGS